MSLTYHNALNWLFRLPIASLRGSRLLFLGIGASHAVLATTVYQLRRTGIYALRSDGDDLPAGSPVMADWYIGISQSGRSPEVVQATQHQPDPARRLCVVNQSDSPLEKVCGLPFCLSALIDSGMSSVALMATAAALGAFRDALTGERNEALWQALPVLLVEVREQVQPVIAHFAARFGEVGCVDFVASAAA